LIADVLMIVCGGNVKVKIPARLLLLGLLVLFLTATGAPRNVRYNKTLPGRAYSSGSDLGPVILVGVVAFIVGFLAAATMSVGGVGPRRRHRHRHHTDWDRVSRDAVAVMRKELAEWRRAEPKEAPDWDEFGHRLEDRLREELESNRE
jgi:hypothetical protein